MNGDLLRSLLLASHPFEFGWPEIIITAIATSIVLGQGMARGWAGKLRGRVFKTRLRRGQDAGR